MSRLHYLDISDLGREAETDMDGGIGKEEEMRGEERTYMILTEEGTAPERKGERGSKRERELLAFAFALA